MRQAIEEGFILDVLANYIDLRRRTGSSPRPIADDPEFDTRKARRASPGSSSLHPHNLAQKAEVIVEHFRDHTRHKIGGRAKAMVVTRPGCTPCATSRRRRLHREQGLRRQRGARRVLRARSIDDDAEFTEAAINGFPEGQTAEQFDEPTSTGVLVVAEKYQTGFDQPLLHTMYVDKKLAVAAVQTLSRLNRTHPGKTTPSSSTSATRPRTSRTRSSPSTRRRRRARPTRTCSTTWPTGYSAFRSST